MYKIIISKDKKTILRISKLKLQKPEWEEETAELAR